MPPKPVAPAGRAKPGDKDKGSGSAPAAAGGPQLDEFDAMDLEELQDSLRKSMLKFNELRRSRNYFQLEKDQIYQFFTVAQEEIDKTQAHIRNLEAQMERMQDTHRNDIRVYLQRVVHLEYDHKNNVEAIEAVVERNKASEAQAHLAKKALLGKAKQQLRAALAQEQSTYEGEVAAMREKEHKEVGKIREKFEKDHQALQQQHEARLAQLREDLELRRKVEVHEAEERKNGHINMLVWNHEAKFEEMRAYYSAITRDNLDLIQALVARIEGLRASQAESEHAVAELDRRNRRIKDPLESTEREIKLLAQKLQSFQKDKASLRQARARKALLQKQSLDLADQHASLQGEYAEAVRQRDALYQHFEDIVLAMQRQAGGRNERLEKALAELQDQYRVKNAQFGAVLRASNLDPVVLANVTRKLDDVLTAKNEQLDELRYEVAKAHKAHADLVRTFEAKLVEFGVPSEGAEAELAAIGGQDASTVPAGLIA